MTPPPLNETVPRRANGRHHDPQEERPVSSPNVQAPPESRVGPGIAFDMQVMAAVARTHHRLRRRAICIDLGGAYLGGDGRVHTSEIGAGR